MTSHVDLMLHMTGRAFLGPSQKSTIARSFSCDSRINKLYTAILFDYQSGGATPRAPAAPPPLPARAALPRRPQARPPSRFRDRTSLLRADRNPG